MEKPIRLKIGDLISYREAHKMYNGWEYTPWQKAIIVGYTNHEDELAYHVIDNDFQYYKIYPNNDTAACRTELIKYGRKKSLVDEYKEVASMMRKARKGFQDFIDKYMRDKTDEV